MEPIVIDPQSSSLVSIKKKKKNDPLEKRQSLKMNPINIDKNNIKKIENEAIHFYWKNLSYKTAKNKILVNNLSGHLQSGYLTAILGPSGSGKTTLFECLAKRRIKGVTGQTWVSSSIR